MILSSQEQDVHDRMWSSLPKRTRVEHQIRQLERSIYEEAVNRPTPEGYVSWKDDNDASDWARAYALEMIAELTKIALAFGHKGDAAANAAGDWLEAQDKSKTPLRYHLYKFEAVMEMLAERGY